MSELLSREKEFIKLNEELDKLAIITTFPSEQQHQQQQQQQQHRKQQTQPIGTTSVASTADTGHNSGGTMTANTQPKNDQRYLTYIKSKGQNAAVLKKRGAGDSISDAVVDLPSDKDRANGSRENRNTRHAKTNTQQTGINSGTSTTTTTNPSPKQQHDAENVTDGRKEVKATPHGATTHRKAHAKNPDFSTRSHSRTSGRTMPASTISTPFTVKYRNPRFVQSPSLEVLVKEESATIRYRQANENASSVHHANDADSISSAAGSVTRRSNDTTMKKQISTDGLIKFLKSKIAILEEDHDRISQEMSQQKQLLEVTLERNKKIEQQRDQAYSKHSAMSEQLVKIEAQLDEANRRTKDRSGEQTTQLKELEIAKRELKMLTQTNTNLEKRLYRANEELENAKNALTLMKNAERELKDTMRNDGDSKDKQIKSLKKQRADLLNAYKKQLFLIDNLKRQNICMEQSKMIGFGEKEFTKVLEWNSKI